MPQRVCNFAAAPPGVFAQALVRDVFATADQRVWPREIFQLGAQWECVLQDANNFLATGALRK